MDDKMENNDIVREVMRVITEEIEIQLISLGFEWVDMETMQSLPENNGHIMVKDCFGFNFEDYQRKGTVLKRQLGFLLKMPRWVIDSVNREIEDHHNRFDFSKVNFHFEYDDIHEIIYGKVCMHGKRGKFRGSLK